MDKEKVGDVLVKLNSINHALKVTVDVAEMASKAGSMFSVPSGGVTDAYFECLWRHLQAGEEWIKSFNLKVLTPASGGPTPAEMSEKQCAEFEKVALTSAKDLQHIVDKNTKALEHLRSYESELVLFEDVTIKLAKVAEDLASKGLWQLAYDKMNMEELSGISSGVREKAHGAIDALEENAVTYKEKQENLDASQKLLRECSEAPQAVADEFRVEVGKAENLAVLLNDLPREGLHVVEVKPRSPIGYVGSNATANGQFVRYQAPADLPTEEIEVDFDYVVANAAGQLAKSTLRVYVVKGYDPGQSVDEAIPPETQSEQDDPCKFPYPSWVEKCSECRAGAPDNSYKAACADVVWLNGGLLSCEQTDAVYGPGTCDRLRQDSNPPESDPAHQADPTPQDSNLPGLDPSYHSDPRLCRELGTCD